MNSQLQASSTVAAIEIAVRPNVTLDIPQSELWRQFFLPRRNPGQRIGRKIGRNFGRNFLGNFVASFTVQNDPPKFLPKFPIYHSMSCHGSL